MTFASHIRVPDSVCRLLVNVYSIAESAALYNTVGLAQAKHLLFTGEQIGALEARQIGLIQEIADDPLAQAQAMARTTKRGRAAIAYRIEGNSERDRARPGVLVL